MAVESFPVEDLDGVGSLKIHDDQQRRLQEKILFELDRIIELMQEILDRSRR